MSESASRPIDIHAVVALGRELKRRGYSFTTVTPATHARVNARADAARARDLRGVFGWSRPFDDESIDSSILDLAHAAGVIVERGDGLRSGVRWSSLGDDLFVHSAFPTDDEDAVFFGPDTVRFAAFLRRAAPHSARRVVDVGCGTGAGGIVLARSMKRIGELVLSDVNARALSFARANAELAGVAARCVESDVLARIDDPIDLVVSNPPYVCDEPARAYRHGGESLGADLSIRIVHEAARRLADGGRLLLYTGSAIVDGADRLRAAALHELARADAHDVRYEEVDPDVFGEELDMRAYAEVERIAAVTLCARFGGSS